MKKIQKVFIFLLLSCSFFGCAYGALAANHYVREGASGANNGSDWTNAWTTLPATLTRGDNYYIADGTYEPYTFDDAGQGAFIFITKATALDHGTAVGWDAAFGDGTAEFTNTLTFSSSMWIVDGVTGGGKEPHGFRIALDDCPSQGGVVQGKGIRINNSPSSIQIQHVEIELCGNINAANDAIYAPGNLSSFTFSENYIHNVSRTAFYMTGWFGGAIENNYFEDIYNSYGIHNEAIANRTSTDVIIRNNVFEDTGGTGILVFGDSARHEIYNNIFFHTADFPGALGNGAIVTWTGYYLSDSQVYGNTFSGSKGNNSGIHFDEAAGSIGNEIYNNLWNASDWASAQGGVNDYNYYSDTDYAYGTTPGPHDQVATGDPFIDSANGDFHLAGETAAGMTLGSWYDTDLEGTTRGLDGNWDRGAYEYVSGDFTPPNAPSGLSVM